MAVARLVAGGVTSRQVAAEVGVEASVVRDRKRRLLREPVSEGDPVRPDDLREEDDGAARPDHDVPDLEGLVAERDRVRAEVERLRREKREAEIELSILKGALELAGIRAGRRPGQPGQ